MDDKTQSNAPRWQSVKHRVVEVPLEECPFYRPGVVQAIGLGGEWTLEFEDGHTETLYEDGALDASDPSADKALE